MTEFQSDRDKTLLGSLEAVRAIHSNPAELRKHSNHILSKDVLRGDLGDWSHEETLPIYGLDKDTSDRLLAHTRQDAAMVAFTLTDLQQQLEKTTSKIRVMMRISCIASIGCLIGMIYLAIFGV